MGVMMLRTVGFANLPITVQMDIVELTIRRIVGKSKPDMIVVYPEGQKPDYIDNFDGEALDDDGRTLITNRVKGLTQKVYVKRDDYGKPTDYDEEALKQVEDFLGFPLPEEGLQVITFMLADEY